MGGLLNGERFSGDVLTRLVDSWRLILPGVVNPDLLPQFEGDLSATAARYRQD